MTARETFNSSIKTATQARLATVSAAEATRQSAADASNSVVGYNLQTGNFSNLDSAVKAANLAKAASLFAAEVTKQAAQDAAREILRSSGDLAPL